MVVIGTWNVENLYRPGGAFGPRTEAAYEAKLSALAGTIHRIAPDLLALQEVGDPEALEDLVERLGDGWHRVLSALPDGRGIRVGYLSRLPLTVLADTADFPALLAPLQASDSGELTTRMGRGALVVRVEPAGGPPVHAVACHLKSKLLTFPGHRFSPRDEAERARFGAYALYRRAAEAVTIRGLADGLLDGRGQERAVLVAGDLNDEPEAATTQILLGPPGSEIGTRGANRPDRGDAMRLWNLAPLLPEGERFSRAYRGRGELIDHILVSHALLGGVKEVHSLVDRSMPSVTDDPSERRDATDSDHAPVVATFTF